MKPNNFNMKKKSFLVYSLETIILSITWKLSWVGG